MTHPLSNVIVFHKKVTEMVLKGVRFELKPFAVHRVCMPQHMLWRVSVCPVCLLRLYVGNLALCRSPTTLNLDLDIYLAMSSSGYSATVVVA